MGGAKLIALVLAVIAAAAVGSSPAGGQCRLCDTPTLSRGSDPEAGDVRLEIQTSLDFDRLVLLGDGEGSATLRPDGSGVVSGTVAAISGRAMVGSAMIRGEAGRAVRVELPRSIELHALSGGRITIEEIVTDLPAAPRLDAAGVLNFRFGGRLRVSGQSDGDHRGEIPITVEYP